MMPTESLFSSDHERIEKKQGEDNMKILHIINDSPTKLSDEIISVQSKDHDVKVINLAKKEASYESIIDDIFAHDRVVSW